MKVNCTNCNAVLNRAPYLVRNSKTGRWFCSAKCRSDIKRTHKSVKCERCGENFTVMAYREGTAKFCSIICRRSGKNYECEGCGTDVYRAYSHAPGQRVFCSIECAGVTRFQAGNKPWNHEMKGIHLSPESEFKVGPRPDKRSPIGQVSIRTRSRLSDRRAWVKVRHPNVWVLRARIVWIASNGIIPDGYVIHHRDRDSLNDDIQNLQLMTRSWHLAEHRDEIRANH